MIEGVVGGEAVPVIGELLEEDGEAAPLVGE